ncbi:hypothetical protein LdCL_260016900 [Leishmania donovani]|uniref:Uncharacterized protein n=1 Tax=Leishmania donovani TaxID=5661 RepID=A0A3Q8IDS0_LEIDO|nr:hypothetical protein LdCL_260016900 [Leishmania donovani]
MPRRRSGWCPFTLSAFASCSQHGLRSSRAAMRHVHARTCHCSSYNLVGRCISSMSSGIADVPTSAAPWERLVHLVTGLPSAEQRSFPLTATGAPTLANVAAVRTALPAIRELWLSAYHPAFGCGVERDRDGAVASAVAASDVDAQRQQHRLLPEEAEELPLFVQALGHLAAALHESIGETTEAAAAAAAVAADDADADTRLLKMHEWLVELQALLLFIGQHHLRFLIPATFSPKLSSLAVSLVPETHTVDGNGSASYGSELSKPGTAKRRETQVSDASSLRQLANEAIANHTSAPPAVVKGSVPGAASLRRLFRHECEHVQDMAPPLPVEELLRVVVLVEAARTILDVTHPPPLASGVRAEVYGVLLSVVGSSEQLSSTTLASLATCLARCVDSYAMRKQLSAVACAPQKSGAVPGDYDDGGGVQARGERFAGVGSAALSAFLRRVSRNIAACSAGTSLTISPSPIEQHEAAQLNRLCGGLDTRLRPTSVLHHLRVLANVMQRRLAKTLYEAEAGHGAHQLQQEAGKCGDDGADVPASSTGAARVAKEARIEAGMLGILTLEELKARAGTTLSDTRLPTATQPRRKRRTVAEIGAAAERNRVGAGNFSAHGNADAPSSHVPHGSAAPPSSTPCDSCQHPHVCHADCSATSDTARVSFTDLAEVCSAMAAIGFRGDDTAAEEPMWRHAVEFACAEIVATADARDAAAAVARADNGDAAGVAADGEAVIRQTLLDARDLCFALDRVDYTHGYDRVMATLVRCGFLREPIPAPSAVRRSMKDIPCSF